MLGISMHPFFNVSADEIQQLTDQQAEEFIAFLCGAEVKKVGLSPSIVIYGGKLKAKDRGIDIKVDPFIQEDRNSYIPRSHTIFQIKAVEAGIDDKAVEKEMIPTIKKDGKQIKELRLSIQELAKTKGAYIIVSTKDNLVASNIDARIKIMKKCLATKQLEQKILVKFYSSQQIADWTNQYIAAVAWIKNVLKKPYYGFKPYTAWAYKEESTENEYVYDDNPIITSPNQNDPINVIKAIDLLRETLHIPKKVVRLVGLSGVGKTRLVQALFDERIETTNIALNQSKVIYTDTSESESTKLYQLVETLIAENKEAILVVDNCSSDMHSKLTEKIIINNSKLSMISIEYDIRDDLPLGTDCYTLNPSSIDTLIRILHKQYPELSDIDIKRISEYADGNARIAYVLADTADKTGSLAKLTDNKLFQRIFLQKHEEDKEFFYCIQTCSLLYSFDSEDISEDSELVFLTSIAANANINIKILRRKITEAQKRGLIQQRGKWKAVLPQAIANRLAEQFINDDASIEDIELLRTHNLERIRSSFSRRLSFLHNSIRAQEIAKIWLNELKEEDLIESHKAIIRNITPIIPKEILNFLSDLDFKKDSNFSFFADLARSLAYEIEYFDQAVKILININLNINKEPKQSYQQNIEKLCSLFWPYLSGTLTPPEQRLDIIKYLYKKNSNAHNKVAILLLKASLKTSNFSSFYSYEFGSRKRDYGYYPKTLDDQTNWYKPFIEYALEIGQQQNDIGIQVRNVIGDELYGLWRRTELDDLLEKVIITFHIIGDWPIGWIIINRLINIKDNPLPKNTLKQLKRLEKLLQPKDLKEEIETYVFSNHASTLAMDQWKGEFHEKVRKKLKI